MSRYPAADANFPFSYNSDTLVLLNTRKESELPQKWPTERFSAHVRQDVSSLPLIKSKVKNSESMYYFLDKYAPEVSKARNRYSNPFLLILDKFTDTRYLNLGRVRDAYRDERDLKREGVIPTGNSFALKAKKIIEKRNQFLDYFAKSEVKFFWELVQLLDYIAFLCLYLAEVQINSYSEKPSHPEMQWLIVYRPDWLYDAMHALNFINLYMTFVAFFSLDRMSAFKIIRNLVDMFQSFWIFALYFVPNGKNIYVPYFLFALYITSSIVDIIRLQKHVSYFSVSKYAEKLLVLILNVVLLIFVGYMVFKCSSCVFNFFENYVGTYLYPATTSPQISLVDTLYYMVITVTTVGYGDVAPKTEAGRLITIFIVIYAFTVFPKLIAQLAHTLTIDRLGEGSFHRGSSDFVVICGTFENAARTKRGIDFIFDNDQTGKLKIVLFGRDKMNHELKNIIDDSEYKRVSYLTGNALTERDFERMDLR